MASGASFSQRQKSSFGRLSFVAGEIAALVSNLQHVGLDENNASTKHSQRAGSADRNIDDATPSKRTSIIDCDDDVSTRFRIGYANARSEWQCSMCSCQATRIKLAAAGDPALICVITSLSGKAVPSARCGR
jgi:hypothetical protein